LIFLSVFDIFTINSGLSSSHSMGSLVAAARFSNLMRAFPFRFCGGKARLHGSLAFKRVGRGTDRVTILGLARFDPQTYLHDHAKVTVSGLSGLKFDPKK